MLEDFGTDKTPRVKCFLCDRIVPVYDARQSDLNKNTYTCKKCTRNMIDQLNKCFDDIQTARKIGPSS